MSVFYDERIVVVAEQRPDASEEDSFQWMSRVLQVSARCAGVGWEGSHRAARCGPPLKTVFAPAVRAHTHTFNPSTQREKRKITVSLRLALSTE